MVTSCLKVTPRTSLEFIKTDQIEYQPERMLWKALVWAALLYNVNAVVTLLFKLIIFVVGNGIR